MEEQEPCANCNTLHNSGDLFLIDSWCLECRRTKSIKENGYDTYPSREEVEYLKKARDIFPYYSFQE